MGASVSGLKSWSIDLHQRFRHQDVGRNYTYRCKNMDVEKLRRSGRIRNKEARLKYVRHTVTDLKESTKERKK
jgi:hypothetical protein